MVAPTDYANLTGWWDASQESFANNDPVGTLTDRSGGGRNLTAAGAVRPTFKTGIFPLGGSALDFDGTDDEMAGVAISNFITATAFTAFAVVMVDAFVGSSANPYSNEAIFADSGGYFGLHPKSGGTVEGYNYDGTNDIVSIALATATAAVFMLRHEGGSLYISKDGGAESSVASGNTGSTAGTLRIGHGLGAFLNGQIGELFIYSVARSTAEIAALNAYLRDKWIAVSGGAVPEAGLVIGSPIAHVGSSYVGAPDTAAITGAYWGTRVA